MQRDLQLGVHCLRHFGNVKQWPKFVQPPKSQYTGEPWRIVMMMSSYITGTVLSRLAYLPQGRSVANSTARLDVTDQLASNDSLFPYSYIRALHKLLSRLSCLCYHDVALPYNHTPPPMVRECRSRVHTIHSAGKMPQILLCIKENSGYFRVPLHFLGYKASFYICQMYRPLPCQHLLLQFQRVVVWLHG